MIIVMNILISLIGIMGIIIARKMVCHGTGMGIKSHIIIILLKLIMSSIVIGFFLIYSEKNLWSLIILSGMINIVVFHFIEAFITQKRLLYHRRFNV